MLGSRGELAGMLIKVSGALMIALGLISALRGVSYLLIGLAFGSFATWLFHPMGWAIGLLALLCPLFALINVIVGAAAALLGLKLFRLLPPLPESRRDQWIMVTIILAVIAAIFGSQWYLLALILVLIGLLLSPTRP